MNQAGRRAAREGSAPSRPRAFGRVDAWIRVARLFEMSEAQLVNGQFISPSASQPVTPVESICQDDEQQQIVDVGVGRMPSLGSGSPQDREVRNDLEKQDKLAA